MITATRKFCGLCLWLMPFLIIAPSPAGDFTVEGDLVVTGSVTAANLGSMAGEDIGAYLPAGTPVDEEIILRRNPSNVVVVAGAGIVEANGTYYRADSHTYTNGVGPGSQLVDTNGAWFIVLGGMGHYVSVDYPTTPDLVSTWTVVDGWGVPPVPIVSAAETAYAPEGVMWSSVINRPEWPRWEHIPLRAIHVDQSGQNLANGMAGDTGGAHTLPTIRFAAPSNYISYAKMDYPRLTTQAQVRVQLLFRQEADVDLTHKLRWRRMSASSSAVPEWPPIQVDIEITNEVPRQLLTREFSTTWNPTNHATKYIFFLRIAGGTATNVLELISWDQRVWVAEE